MGTKYGSLHVRTNDPDATLKKLKAIYSEKSAESKDMLNIKMERLFKINDGEMEKVFHTLLENLPIGKSCLFIVSQQFISIHDEDITMFDVKAEAESLSKQIDEPILYAGNFDDDCVIIGVMSGGENLVSGGYGSFEDPSVFQPHKVNISKLKELLDLEFDEAAFDQSIHIESPVFPDTEIESFIGVDFHMHIDFIDDGFNLIDEFNCIKVYQKTIT